MCCLTCTYFDPIEPVEHKIARESGQCEAQCGRDWGWYTAFRYVQSHDGPLHGVCRFNPAGINKPGWDICGQHKPVLSPNENGWGIQEFGRQRDGLLEWARKQYLNIKENGPRRDEDRLREENQSLRRQLAAARKRSASRLARLQKAAKPKPAQSSNSPEPQPMAPLRLVANG